MIHLYAEHLLNINTLSIQASLDTASDSGTSAALSNDGKSLVVSHERERTSTELPTYISPGQADSIKFPILSGQSTELSFRIPLDAKAQNGTGTLRKEDSDHGNLVPLSAAALTSRTEIYCSQCSSVVVERGRIQIWKDMPSQGWAEMMEFWHCHKPHEPHRHEEGEMQKGYAAGSKLAVEPGIGLVDTGDFIFAPEDCINLEVSLKFHHMLSFSRPFLVLLATIGLKGTGALAPHGTSTGRQSGYNQPKNKQTCAKLVSALRKQRSV